MRQLIQLGIRTCIRLTLLLFTITPTIYAVFTKSNCTELAAHTQCQCSHHSPLAYDIKCRKGKNLLTVTIQILQKEDEQPHVILDCNHIDASEYSVLRAIDIGKSSFVQIKRCQLSAVLSTQFFDSMDTPKIFIYNSSLEANYTRKDFSVLSGLKTLTLKLFDFSLMPNDLFMDLKNLISLRLSHDKVELARNIFAGLENLETLMLDHNNLQQLPVGIFRSQLKLKKLDLSCNQLRNLSRDVFEGAISLSALNLSLNGIESLQPGVFSLLTNLSEIYLNKNHFQTLPPELFAENRKLDTIQLFNNRAILTSLPPALLANLPYLQEVHITYTNDLSRDNFDDIYFFPHTGRPIGKSVVHMRCGMSEIPGDLLINSSKIIVMALSGNQLVTLPGTLLKGQNKLYLLDLTRNKLQYLPDELFNDLTNLYGLFLSYNQLTEITDNIFASLVNLKCLWINNNRLKTINSNAFSRTTNIIELNMENNRLTCGDHMHSTDSLSPFQYLYNLKTLNLRNNSVQYIYYDWKYSLNNLVELNLSHNNITSLNFYDLEFFSYHAVFINMSHNQIKLINFIGDEMYTKYTSEHVHIDLSNNPMVCDCKLLPFVTYLHGGPPYLPYLKLNFITDRLFCMKPDDMADLLLCRYCPLGCKCRSYDSVLVVNCSNADLTAVPTLPLAQSLGLQSIVLHIENDNILKLATVYMPGYADVTQIYAAGNYISEINVYNLPENLTHLDLSRNRFNRLNTNILHYFRQKHLLLKIALGENPWNCDCKLLPLVQFVKMNLSMIIDIERVYCAATKNNLAVSLVRDVQPISLLCPIETKDCPPGCTCWKRSYDSVLIVNCNNSDLKTVSALPLAQTHGLQSTEFYIENNNLLKLHTVYMPGYANVTRIYAAGNRLSEINVDNLPENLTYLDLSRNSFNTLNTSVLSNFNQKRSLPRVALADNPWNCDCKNLPFMQFVKASRAVITDVDKVYCAASKNQTIFDYIINDDICEDDQRMIIGLTVSIPTVGFLLALFAALYYKYQIEIKVWIYNKRICICLVNEDELDKNKKFDAFVSYSHKDEEFIALSLVPELENGPIPFRLCIHIRDFIVGEYIPDQIIHAIEDSKRTIVVLSRNFIESVWARMEFRTAHQAALNEGRTRVIVIVYSDIGDTELLDSDLKAYLKMNTYLKWGDPWFWDKLRYAMPHSKSKPRKLSLLCDNTVM